MLFYVWEVPIHERYLFEDANWFLLYSITSQH